MRHKFIMELEDTTEGYEAEVERLDMLLGIEPIEEYEKQIREEAFDELASTLKLNWAFWGNKSYRDEIDKVVERLKENSYGI